MARGGASCCCKAWGVISRARPSVLFKARQEQALLDWKLLGGSWLGWQVVRPQGGARCSCAFVCSSGGGGPLRDVQVPGWVHRKLEIMANWVVAILVELTTATRVGPDKVKIPAMPKSAVRHTQVANERHRPPRLRLWVPLAFRQGYIGAYGTCWWSA